MSISTSQILDALRQYGINTFDDNYAEIDPAVSLLPPSSYHPT